MRTFTLDEIYCRWLVLSDYNLNFSYQELEKTFKEYVNYKWDKNEKKEDFENDLEANKEINKDALNYIRDYLNL